MKTRRTKGKSKYTELRAAIAAIRRNNGALLEILPQWKYGSGGETPPPQVRENVAAFFRERGKARFGENTVRSLEGEKPQAVCLAEIGDGVLKKIAAAMGGNGRTQLGASGVGTGARTRRGGMGGEGRRGPQTAFMAKQRKVFLEHLKVRPETASVSRITRARECWAIHRKEWDAAAKKRIGYADYKGLARSQLI